MRITQIAFFTCLFFVVTTVHAASIKQREYAYRYDCAKGLQDETFLICGNCNDDRPTHLVALAVRMVSTPQQVVTEKEVHAPPAISSLIDTIQFKFDSASLLPAARSSLDKIVEKNGVHLAGYTCSIGSPVYNVNLSQHRADAVARYLTRRGISVLSVTGYGQSLEYPGYTKNRRVEVRVDRKETF